MVWRKNFDSRLPFFMIRKTLIQLIRLFWFAVLLENLFKRSILIVILLYELFFKIFDCKNCVPLLIFQQLNFTIRIFYQLKNFFQCHVTILFGLRIHYPISIRRVSTYSRINIWSVWLLFAVFNITVLCARVFLTISSVFK